MEKFSSTMDSMQIFGEVWFDSITGLPLEVVWEINSTPFEQDGMKILKYHQIDEYHIDSIGNCQIKQTLTNIEAEYSFLLMTNTVFVETRQEFKNLMRKENLPMQQVRVSDIQRVRF